MELQHTDRIEAPVEQVYMLVRDKLPEIAAYLPSIRKIECVSMREIDGTHREIENRWFANIEVPSLVQKFLPAEMFSWRDIAKWDDTQRRVTYELASFFANDLFSASGSNLFEADGKYATRLTVTCHVEIHGDKVPGVPWLLAAKVTPMIEKLIEKMIAPNLTSLGEGLRGYLKGHAISS